MFQKIFKVCHAPSETLLKRRLPRLSTMAKPLGPVFISAISARRLPPALAVPIKAIRLSAGFTGTLISNENMPEGAVVLEARNAVGWFMVALVMHFSLLQFWSVTAQPSWLLGIG